MQSAGPDGNGPTMLREVGATISAAGATMTTFAAPVASAATTGSRPSLSATRPAATQSVSRAPSIADQYAGLLDDLNAHQRRGLIAKLANGYYDEWRPTRAQLLEYLQSEYGVTPRDRPVLSRR